MASPYHSEPTQVQVRLTRGCNAALLPTEKRWLSGHRVSIAALPENPMAHVADRTVHCHAGLGDGGTTRVKGS